MDVRKGGCFSIRPSARFESTIAYVPHTNILQTRFILPEGVVALTDFMPVADGDASSRSIFRRIWCVRGKAEIEILFRPSFDYARQKARFVEDGGNMGAQANGESLWLQSPFPLRIADGAARTRTAVGEGQVFWLVLHHGENRHTVREVCEETLKRTICFWTDWANIGAEEQLDFEQSWRELTLRSSLVLKLLTRPATGAIAAAATMSLPEIIHGVRNWDYRYAWVRDAAFTVQALSDLGHKKAAQDYFRWISKLCESGKDVSDIRVCYRSDGIPADKEQDLENLEGYKESRPVRLGNQAAHQFQLDIYGELVNAVYETIFHGHRVPENTWPLIRSIIDYVCEKWTEPDSGIWEMRKPPVHYTYSKLMAWVAVDRGLRMAKKFSLNGVASRWRETAAEIRKAILDAGYNDRMKSFVQAFGSADLDATSLLIPTLGFLEPKDPRVVGTIEATMKHLCEDGLVYRYRVDDGLPGKESPFVLCTFWLVTALILSGRLREAEEYFERAVRRASPTGLYGEQIDPASGEHRGNFPQGFSHIGLINSAFYLSRARKGEAAGPKSIQEMRESTKPRERSRTGGGNEQGGSSSYHGGVQDRMQVPAVRRRNRA